MAGQFRPRSPKSLFALCGFLATLATLAPAQPLEAVIEVSPASIEPGEQVRLTGAIINKGTQTATLPLLALSPYDAEIIRVTHLETGQWRRVGMNGVGGACYFAATATFDLAPGESREFGPFTLADADFDTRLPFNPTEAFHLPGRYRIDYAIAWPDLTTPWDERPKFSAELEVRPLNPARAEAFREALREGRQPDRLDILHAALLGDPAVKDALQAASDPMTRWKLMGALDVFPMTPRERAEVLGPLFANCKVQHEAEAVMTRLWENGDPAGARWIVGIEKRFPGLLAQASSAVHDLDPAQSVELLEAVLATRGTDHPALPGDGDGPWKLKEKELQAAREAREKQRAH